jgi:hypothetical protein
VLVPTLVLRPLLLLILSYLLNSENCEASDMTAAASTLTSVNASEPCYSGLVLNTSPPHIIAYRAAINILEKKPGCNCMRTIVGALQLAVSACVTCTEHCSANSSDARFCGSECSSIDVVLSRGSANISGQ